MTSSLYNTKVQMTPPYASIITFSNKLTDAYKNKGNVI